MKKKVFSSGSPGESVERKGMIVARIVNGKAIFRISPSGKSSNGEKVAEKYECKSHSGV